MRRRFCVTLMLLTLLVASALAGCGQEEPRADRQKPEDSASGKGAGGATTTDEAPEPASLGETAEVGPFAVTLNSAKRLSTDDGRYAVMDLTLENRAEEPADASSADFLLRDEEGYSFESGAAPDQRPRPSGQIEPGDKASGQVGFDVGDQPTDGRLELSVTLSDEPQAARFEFEAEEEKQEPQPKPKPESAEKKEPPAPSVRPGYSLVEDPSGSLSVEVPSSWNSQTGEDSEGPGGESSWSYYAGEYLSASITTARSLDAWYGGPVKSEGSGAYMVASESLAQQYTDDELIYSLLHQKKEINCTAGPSQELDRAPYSGKVQTWFNCNGLGTDYYVFAAAPEGRACVVVGGARVVQGASETDQEAIEHIIDSFEVDCGSLPPSTPLESQATTSASASASATPSASPEPSDLTCEEIQAILNGEAPGIEALTPEELLACGLSPEAIDPCEGNPDPNCGENLPEGAYPSINGPESSPPSSPDPNYDAPNPNVPGASPGTGGCVPPAYYVPDGDPRDGDNDNCAGE